MIHSYGKENPIEKSDFLLNWSVYNEENDRVTRIGKFLGSYDFSGYADFKELGFIK